MNLTIKKKETITLEKLKVSTTSYCKQSFITYKGLLVYLGISAWDLKRFEKASVVDDDCEEASILKFLYRFKEAYEAKLEEYLVYQGQHSDLKDCYVNYTILKSVLDKSIDSGIYKDNKKLIDGSVKKVYPIKITNTSGHKIGN